MPSMVEIEEAAQSLHITDCWNYAGTSTGAFHRHRGSVDPDCRIGQWFFNNLNESDQNKLRGTLHDPFYSNDWFKVKKALAFLLMS